MKFDYIEITAMQVSLTEYIGIVRSGVGDKRTEHYRGEYKPTHWAAYQDAVKYYETNMKEVSNG